MTWRAATPQEARRLAAALDALIRGWAMAEAERRLAAARDSSGDRND